MSTELQAPTVTPVVSWGDGRTDGALRRHVLSGATMGTRYSATFYAADALDLPALQGSLQAAVDAVDADMSVWKADSAISRLNRAATGQWIAVPSDLLDIVVLGIDIGRASGGAFELGIGRAVGAWGFGPGDSSPDIAAIETLAGTRQPKAAKALEIDRPAGRMRRLADLSLDLNGIAKGFGVDRLAECLERDGISRYMVSIDGELRMRGLKPGGSPWSIAVEAPTKELRQAAEIVALTDIALATSGDYRHWVEIGGTTYSHSIDPRTQRAISGRLASVTVAAPSCAVADAWATALLVSGEVEGPRMAAAQGLSAIFLLRDGEALRSIHVGSL